MTLTGPLEGVVLFPGTDSDSLKEGNSPLTMCLTEVSFIIHTSFELTSKGQTFL